MMLHVTQSEVSSPMQKGQSVEARLMHLQSTLEMVVSQIQSLTERVNEIEATNHSTTVAIHKDLNIIKGQIHTIVKQASDVNFQEGSDFDISVSLPDLIEYVTDKKQKNKKNTLYLALYHSISNLPNNQTYRIVNDLSTLHADLNIPPTVLAPYNSVFRKFLNTVVLKEDFDDKNDNELLLQYLQGLGMPLYNPNCPTEVLLIPVINGLTVFTAGYSPIFIFNSAIKSLNAKVENITVEYFGAFLQALHFFCRVNVHFISAIEQYKSITPVCPSFSAITTTLQRVYTLFNYILPQRSGNSVLLDNDEEIVTNDPKVTMLEFVYFTLFIIHILNQSALLDQFKLRHPAINNMMADEILISIIPDVSKFLSDAFNIKLTDKNVEYNTFCDLFKQKVNMLDCFQREDLNNNPNEYLRLATNGELIAEHKWPQLLQDIVNRELFL